MTLFFLDAHVHLHQPEQLPQLIKTAEENAPAAAQAIALFITQTPQEYFRDSVTKWIGAAAASWDRGECISLPSSRPMYAFPLAQRKLRNGLEVHVTEQLAQTTDWQVASLQSLAERCRSEQQKLILPWGFGKWCGARGRAVAEIQAQFPETIILSDSQLRPPCWQAQFHFQIAGADPLPIRGDLARVARLGTMIEAVSPSLNALLSGGSMVGTHLDTWSSLRRQILLRYPFR